MDLSQANIFQEKQGSNLCAQHALNNLLQTPLFTAGELASIAQELDQLEAAQLDPDEALQDRHGNADETGFFSVAVIEKALEIVGLKLTRWDSQDMKPYASAPEAFSAFILNLEQHWFVMRRFSSNSDWWFNLNSFLPQPERISKLYLGLQLHQAQRERYSVFVVLPDDVALSQSKTAQDCLPHCRADDFFLSHAHLAYSSFGRSIKPSNLDPNSLQSALSPGASSSGSSRQRSGSWESDEGGRKRRRNIPADRPASAIDEEEMLRRAIEASMADVVPSRPQITEISSDSDDTEPEPDQSQAALTQALANVDVRPPVDSGFEEDAPTVDELRAKRLARFGKG